MKLLKDALELLKGKKTFIFSALGALTALLWLYGVIPQELAEQLLTLLGFGGLASLRHGMLSK